MKFTYLEWEDACDDTSTSWKTEGECLEWASKTRWMVRQTGFVLQEDKNCIVLACKTEPGSDEWEASFKHISRIPKTWIRKRIDLTKYIK